MFPKVFSFGFWVLEKSGIFFRKKRYRREVKAWTEGKKSTEFESKSADVGFQYELVHAGMTGMS